MISILYPKDDYTSADIAIKLQALAQAQAKQIFIVPKHAGRNEENVYKNLQKSKTAILLMHDKLKLDTNTLKEVNYLLKIKARIFAIAPIHSKVSMNTPDPVSTHYYDQRKPGDFLNAVQSIISDLQNSQKQTANADFGTLLVVLAIIIFIVAAFDNAKK